MSRKKNDAQVAQELINQMVVASEPVDINEMPLNTLGDYMRYNAKARELNKKLRLCRYPVKQCPIELHPKERVEFMRNDGNSSDLPVYKSDEMIHFDMKLTPGKVYDLPRYIVQYLGGKGYSVWKWFNNADGTKETRVSHKDPRFSLRTIYQD